MKPDDKTEAHHDEQHSGDSGADTPKRAYSPPRLTVYGNARELTRKVGSKKKLDGQGVRRTGF